MNFLKRIAVLFSVTLGLMFCTFLIAFTLNWISYDKVINLLHIVYYDETLKFITGIIALTFLLSNFLLYYLFSVNVHRDKVIAFDNPSGRVSVSLVAMEDLVKRTLTKMSEIREVKNVITATKKGLQAKIKLIIRSDVNIPEFTSKVQELIKGKIQDTIGLDESVDILIYIGKIVPDHLKEKSEDSGQLTEEKASTNIPFQGYRA